jgi:polyphosphate kinase 2 (PPK2 family)
MITIGSIDNGFPIMSDAPNPETIIYNDQVIRLEELLGEYDHLQTENANLKKTRSKAIRRFKREEELKPYQGELIKMQQYLESTRTRMIILFEGRDAAGKGGTIRRVTRYMNEKHYRVVALGKPTEEQKTQWFFQKYVAEFPRGGEVVLFDRSWYNRAVVEPIFGFCTRQEYDNFVDRRDRIRNGSGAAGHPSRETVFFGNPGRTGSAVRETQDRSPASVEALRD